MRVCLKIQRKAGTTIQLRYGEMLHPDGRLMTENLRKARATDSYVLKGDPNGESWSPKFTYHGFQYVEVSGLESRLDKDMITGLSSVTPKTGQFESGNQMINQLYRNVVRTQKENSVVILSLRPVPAAYYRMWKPRKHELSRIYFSKKDHI